MYRIGFIALVLSGCSKPDCEAFGNKVASHETGVNAATDVSIAAFEACKKGETPAWYVKCVLAANTKADEDKCSESGATKTEAKPKHIVQGPGFFLDLPSGWKKTDMNYNIMSLDNEAQHIKVTFLSYATVNKDQWNDDAACKVEAEHKRADMSAELESAGLVATKLGKACRYVVAMSGTRDVITTWAVSPDTLVMNCLFDTKLSKPPASCDEIAALITLGDNR
jgi:hypothetical protein